MATPRRVISRTSATVLSVVFITIFSILRNLHLLHGLGFESEEEYVDHLPVVGAAPQQHKNDDAFSGCLLIMDDNHFLIEWLAYHYHTLPLRRLIVAVDPNSMTSPTPILNRWRNHGGMRIDEWTDRDFMPSNAMQRAKQTLKSANITDETRLHHFRQRVFYNKCFTHLKKENRTWTIFLDSDEYLVLNQRKLESNTPSLKKAGSILSFIKQHLPKNAMDYPCIMIPRLRFGATESFASQDNDVPPALNASRFQTLRFQKHAGVNDFTANKMGKGILDISRIPADSRIKDPHRLVWKYCPKSGLKTLNEDSPFVIHHYLGTWEQYNFRNDVRKGGNRSFKSFEQFKDLNVGKDDSIRPWLSGFIEENGENTAVELLEGVGDVERWPLVENEGAESGDELNELSLDTFSACLIVMNDNHILKEWLAYHYHALPLRHLIVAVDPRSITSPSVILNRWRKHGMTIEEWSDKDYLSEKLLQLAQNVAQLNETALTELNLACQMEFYKQCMLSCKTQNRTWTMMMDTDEFLMINKRGIDRFNVTDVPPVEQPGSVMTVLRQELAKNETEMPNDTPCIMIHRLRFGSQESNYEQVNLHVPDGFNGSAFTTLRHRKHAELVPSKINEGGKVIVDVSRVHPANMHVNDERRPLFLSCSKSETYTQIKDNLFVIHHYSGTLEQFTFRNDPRGDAKAKQAFAAYANLTLDDDAIRPWLGGFVKDKGVGAAAELLEGVGELQMVENTKVDKQSETLNEDDVFSACLLVMDDNHVLIEWLAYHYHALPLRHLIVAVDPRSITSPAEILSRWREHGMTIEEWSDKDFMSEKLYSVAQRMPELNKTGIIELHRARQREFYERCMKHLKSQKRKWTMLTDTDEFLLINKNATDRFNVTDAPPLEQPGSIMTFLKQERAKNVTEMPKHASCIMIPRLRFGSKESEPEKVNLRVPVGFNASAFTTLRHRKHAEKRLSLINKTGKVIVDVSRLHPNRMKVKNPHRPLWAYCPKSELYTQIKDNLFIIHHYAGTWEQYTFRDDYRAMKTKEEFDKYNNRNNDDDAIRPWLEGFVQDKGKAATALLKDVGDVPPKIVSLPAS